MFLKVSACETENENQTTVTIYYLRHSPKWKVTNSKTQAQNTEQVDNKTVPVHTTKSIP